MATNRIQQLRELAEAGLRLKTYDQLRSIIGSEHPPCSKCGCPALAILPTGDAICEACEPDQAAGHRVAMRIEIVTDASGVHRAADRQRELDDCRGTRLLRNERYELERPDGTHTVYRSLQDEIPADMLADEWWEKNMQTEGELTRTLERIEESRNVKKRRMNHD